MNDENNYVCDTNLGQLWEAGVTHIPGVADEYADICNKVHASRGDADDGLAVNSSAGGLFGAVYSEWLLLRDNLQTILATTATNLSDTGTALANTARDLASADEDAANDIDKHQQDVDAVEVTPPKLPPHLE